MSKQFCSRVATSVVMLAALGLAPAAGAAQKSQPPTWCPEGAVEFCDNSTVRPDPDRVKPRIVPRAAKGPYGQQGFRSGRWLME